MLVWVMHPEAELARELIGFDYTVPLIAGGRVQWLALQHGKGAGDYIKPSPVQALAAIGAAFSNEELPALHAAAALVENKYTYCTSRYANQVSVANLRF